MSKHQESSAPPGPPPDYQQYAQDTHIYQGTAPPPPYTAQPGQYLPEYPNFVRTQQGYGAIPPATTVIITQTQPDVVIIGACPACRVGVLQDDFTCLGVLCAIFFFPLGLLCCLALREKKCRNCGATFDA
ncbi:brain protein I3 [Sitophilus oryzae]|uniref:Membrane protein BRI3 n=1 Tax=Sitophilus oryzae TaxID=7048 RepID=A0A6J2XQW9_SITOR|nr:brain protein I3 [Sitophilus oryzae]XP_030753467.1 brain protein I3 [Sitophilus oryzae]XP_030753468.1 brain protein I3 [Sitophilus oryzae]XP_030753469.1 brain protein I3 [Sitophilus oryzae]